MTRADFRRQTDARRPARRLVWPPLLFVAALSTALPVRAAPAGDITSMSLEQLLEISVLGASKYEQKQSEVAAAVSVVTREEIKAFGWLTLDDALTSLPGMHVSYDRQYTYLGTRGFGLPGDYNTRVLVTINGNRLNDPTYDGGPSGRLFPLDLDLIERIEYIPGPGGAVYGQNAMFGVINLVTRKGADVGGAELAAAYQHPQAMREGRASWGRKFDRGLDVLVSASGMRSRGEDLFMDFGAAGVSGVATGLDGTRNQQFFGRIAQGAWSFEHVYGKYRKGDPTGAFFSDPLMPGQYQADVYAVTQLQYQDRFADDTLQVSARLFAGEERYDATLLYDGAATEFPTRTRWRGLEARLLTTPIADHKLMLGVEAQDNTRSDQGVLDAADHANDLLVSSPGYRIGVYAQDEWRLNDSLSATLGVRVDRNNATGTQTSPRAALIWRAAPATAVKGLYGRAHRAPNAYERDYGDGIGQVSNLALGGETVDTLEVVVDHRVGTDLTVRGSVYQWTMTGLVTLGIDADSGLSQYQSGEDVKARGLELSADKAWASGIRLRGSVSVQDVSNASGARLLNSPKLLGKLNLSTPLPWAGLRLAYELRYDSPRLSIDGSALGGYALSNLQLRTAALAPGLEVALGVYNLFDKPYAHPGSDINWQNALPQDGRSVRLKASYRF